VRRCSEEKQKENRRTISFTTETLTIRTLLFMSHRSAEVHSSSCTTIGSFYEMLQTKPLQDLLSQALSSNIHTAVLATPQGTLIAHAVIVPPNTSSQGEGPRRQARSLAAIANVIWKNYANIKNLDELWDTPNGTSNGEMKQGLVWTAVDCEVCLHLSKY
jgi:hypothetical protein